MENEFVLPKKWFLKVNSENLDVVNSWRGGGEEGDRANFDTHYPYISSERWGCFGDDPAMIEITNLQFRRYVLGIDKPITPIVNENLDYLIEILNKIT